MNTLLFLMSDSFVGLLWLKQNPFCGALLVTMTLLFLPTNNEEALLMKKIFSLDMIFYSLLLLLCGIPVGWMMGLSVSPVLKDVLSALLALVVGLVGVFAGLQQREGNSSSLSEKAVALDDTSANKTPNPEEHTPEGKEETPNSQERATEQGPAQEAKTPIEGKNRPLTERLLPLNPLPVVGLLFGIGFGAFFGIQMRTHDSLSPDSQRYIKELQDHLKAQELLARIAELQRKWQNQKAPARLRKQQEELKAQKLRYQRSLLQVRIDLTRQFSKWFAQAKKHEQSSVFRNWLKKVLLTTPGAKKTPPKRQPPSSARKAPKSRKKPLTNGAATSGTHLKSNHSRARSLLLAIARDELTKLHAHIGVLKIRNNPSFRAMSKLYLSIFRRNTLDTKQKERLEFLNSKKKLSINEGIELRALKQRFEPRGRFSHWDQVSP